jgi:hypothetical protein
VAATAYSDSDPRTGDVTDEVSNTELPNADLPNADLPNAALADSDDVHGQRQAPESDPLADLVAQVAISRGLQARYRDVEGPLRPVVLRRRANALVRIDPYPVVARVANWTASVRENPSANLRVEVNLSRWAASRGIRVPVPLPGSLAGPHEEDGVTMTLWPARPDGGPVTDPGAAGRALADLHLAMAGFPGWLPGPEPIATDANRAMLLLGRMGYVDADEALLVADECRELLASLQRLIADLAPHRLVALHGDAHPGNAMMANGHVVWFDLEDAWRGPIEWDVAVLTMSPRWTPRQAEIAARQYCAQAEVELDKDLLAACRQLRNAQIEAWQAIAAAAGRPAE